MQITHPEEGINHKKVSTFSSLYEISRVLGASLDFNKLLNVILSTMIKQTDADGGSLMLVDETANDLYIGAYKGMSDALAKKTRVKLGEGIAGVVAQQKRSLLINDKTFLSLKSGQKQRKDIKSSLSIPLVLIDNTIGVINLNRISYPKEFKEEDLKAIKTFATESAIAIHNAKLYIAAEEKIQHLFRFNVISCALNAAFNQEKILSVMTDCMCELFSFNFFTILLIEKNNYHLIITTCSNLSPKTLSYLKKNLASVISSIKKEAISTRKLKVTIKNLPHLRFSKQLIHPRNLISMANAPIITKGRILGMLSIYSTNKDSFGQKDQQSLTTLANQTAVALENANLYKSLRETYLSTIKALAQAIEEKDPYTRGHSELVSHYAVAITQALQLPNNLVESIQIAGILHDIGKIGIPEKILSKPGKLTAKEYDVIKNHPLIGKRILDPVSFLWGGDLTPPKKKKDPQREALEKVHKKIAIQFKVSLETTKNILKTSDLSEEIKTMIYHHHERYDGRGYPSRLKGEKIPICSRILSVADTFEAMTAHRPYRKAFPLKKAMQLIKECAPAQLDPEIVNVFLALIKKKLVKIK